MKYKSIICALLFSAIFCLSSTEARAEWFSFETIQMVSTNDSSDDLSRTLKSSFGLDETPYLYLKLPADQNLGYLSGYHLTGSTWTGPSEFPLPSGMELSSSRELWISLPYWDLVKEEGTWNVDAAFFYMGGMKGKGSTSFAVSPEPVSTVLFLAGGGIFAVALRRKKKFA